MMEKSLLLLLGIIQWAFILGIRAELGVRLPNAANFLADPDNITVGMATDLEVEVECANMSGAGSYEWKYRNGTSIPDSLQPFGVSQGMGGVLRVYPASELMENNEFVCCSSGTTLNVTFNLVDNIFFTSPIPSVLDDNLTVDHCTVPDIPMATVSLTTNENGSFCEVETRRGNYRSVNVINNNTSDTSDSIINMSVSIFNPPELVLLRGRSSNVSLGCEDDDLFLNGTLVSDRSIGVVEQEDAGIYQCLSSLDESTTALLYVIVAFLDTPIITTPTINITLGVDTNDIILNCTVEGHPLPRLTWTSATLEDHFLTSAQAVTGFMERAQSSLTLNASSLPIGNHNISCSASIDTVNINRTLVQATVSVVLVFENINVTPDPVEVDLRVRNFATITCIVDASVEPEFEFFREGEEVTGGETRLVDVNRYMSQANISDLSVGTFNVRCQSFLNVANAPPTLEASTTVNVTVLFENISIMPSTSNVILGAGPDEVTVSCSVMAGIAPSFTFLVDGQEISGATPPTNTGDLYSSNVTLLSADNFTEIGSRVITCLSSVPGLNLSTNASVTVGATFANLTLADDAGGQVVISDPLDGNLTLTCSITASLVPTFRWTRNGDMITNFSITDGFSSVLVVRENELNLPMEVFECFASLEIPGGSLMNLSDTVMVDVSLNFTDIFVSPQNDSVTLGGSPSDSAVGVVNLTCSLMASLLPVISWNRNDGLAADGTGAMFVGGGRVESVLTVNVAEVRGPVDFTCTASLQRSQFNGSLNATTSFTVNEVPLITVPPANITIAVAGDNITLMCSAEGFPPPTITWHDGNFDITSNNSFNIASFSHSSTFAVPTVTNSTLQFTANASRAGNNSQFICMADNELGLLNSSAAILRIAGPPNPPGSFNVSGITSSNATFSWTEPFSLVGITQYNLTFLQVASDSSSVFQSMPQGLSSDQLSFAFSEFLPFSNYSVSITASNRAGVSEAMEVVFVTEESTPGSPVNLSSVANQSESIVLVWAETPVGERNGNLTGYVIEYRISSSNMGAALVNSTNTIILIDQLTAGTLYMLRVAAFTRAGRGPFSDPIQQMTITVPPEITNGGFQVDPDNPTSSTTITVTLPNIAASNDFSHYWVIAMKVNENFDPLSQNPKEMFPSNASFTFHSDTVPVNTPYIVAEISSANYEMARTFIVGDNASNKYNDYSRYVNGPLASSTRYTVFVWGFSPVPENGRAKRQVVVAPDRQYDSFSSSPFLTPASTRGVGGLSGGEIAAIVIVIIIILAMLVAIAVLICILCERWRYTAEIGPPPSRKGSMRLRDPNEIIRDPMNSGTYRAKRTSTIRSSFRAAAGLTLKNTKIEAELEDLNPNDARLPVMEGKFASYARSMHKNTDHLFSEEYEIIGIKSPGLPHIQCSLPANVNKNRYANINCYDNSRVALKGDLDVIGSDYINANYIDGYKNKCGYIAAQGPLANTTHDFWRMVWEQESCCIIMLTNLVEKSRTKCHQYWPEVGSMNMGDITITLIEVQDLAYYTIRTFRVSRGSEMREIKQFHYTGWPDFGVPDYPSPVIAFIKRVEHFKRTTDGPDVIHCSAGVGRTGTLIAIQCMMHMLEEEGKIDIFNFVLGMRHQRNYMVQTERQYIFIHDTILEHIQAGNTEVSIQDLRRRYKELLEVETGMQCSNMELEYDNLKHLQDVDSSQYHPAQLSVNTSKNRYPEILPYDKYRVRLLLHPGVVGSDYINASYLDGYHRRHQYVITQGPMNNTVTDFWRMVWEHRCSCIMMLCPLEEDGKEQSVCYWPTDKVRQHGDMFIEQVSVSKFPSYTMREVAITNTKINESRTIKHYHYDSWLESQAPSCATDLIDLIGVLQKTQNKNGGGPVIVHDNTGIGRGGAFVVLSSVLEQLKVEGVIDPFFTIHSLRQQQPGLVTNFDQYRFCYQAVLEFLDSFDHYANFD